MIALQIKPRGKPIKKLPNSVEVDLSTTTVKALYERIAAHTGLGYHRLRLTKGSDGSHLVAKHQDGKLIQIDEAGLRDNSVVYVKDLGPQIGWRTVFVVEYLGPLLIHPLMLYVLRPFVYSSSPLNPLSYLPFAPSFKGNLPPPSFNQVLVCWLTTLHFLKREYETLFVHRFSAATMPFRNIFKNSAHYWILSGINLAYFLYMPAVSPTASWWPKSLDPMQNPNVIYAACALWLFSEASNFHTHMTLRNLRPSDGSTKRQIPRGYGFNLVTCPNYLFESLAWFAVMILSGGHWASVLFLVVSTGQMMAWAKKKEHRYRKEFGRAYKKKSSMFPGLW
ncbi:hypothetical protein EX30DRAFT_392562 [Ascodesmis nigricans]|uniref:3-oxo-5-alpha-steroid 4-dehydrogenase C-terminal domain-containing protein n=1 Tax=Ascodesmis nigricans TaxID=341454 RepID=A0A4S2N7G3_9PEZI|nr:hypothetical protein EX30DRAFT_392562 [Ascodesmis nigricans]